jgi:hypothetical protein
VRAKASLWQTSLPNWYDVNGLHIFLLLNCSTVGVIVIIRAFIELPMFCLFLSAND